MKKVFLDTETTGFSPGQIGQLSLIVEDETTKIYAKNYFFSIKSITQGAEEACGRGLEFYKEASGGKIFADYADEIFNELMDSTIIAHNLKFDENFLSTEFWRVNKVFKPLGTFDTMEYFRNICKIPWKGNQYKNPKLEELVDSFSINKAKVEAYSKQLFEYSDIGVGFHDARYDTTSMFVAFQVYKESLYNQTSWKEQFCL